MIKLWSDEAWEDFIYWKNNDENVMRNILLVLRDIDRNEYRGIGRPERLKGELSDYWSKKIDACNRIVYRIDNDIIKIIQCGSHYRDK